MRQRVMNAAVEEMAICGVRFTMNDLATRLGISKRTLYQVFSSKEELIEAIVLAIQDNIREQRQVIVHDSQLDFPAKLQGVIVVRQQAFSAFEGRMLEEIRRCFPSIWESVERFINDEWSAVEAVLRQGVEAGLFRPVYIPMIIKMVKGSIKEILGHDFDCCKEVTKLGMMELLSEVILYGIVERKEESV